MLLDAASKASVSDMLEAVWWVVRDILGVCLLLQF